MYNSRALSLSGNILARSRLSCKASRGSSGSAASDQAQPRTQNSIAKAAITSGTFSLLGDLLAQLVPQRRKLRSSLGSVNVDLWRLARMGGFGLFFYGPYQFKWYGALDRQWPSGGVKNFLIKVILNQIALSPVVLTFAFSWNLALTNQTGKIGSKLSRDLLPTMVNGWKFWVPAASVNFAVIPLQYQVLYMSICSVLWTAYISHTSNQRAVG